jgi:hypothetical protein
MWFTTGTRRCRKAHRVCRKARFGFGHPGEADDGAIAHQIELRLVQPLAIHKGAVRTHILEVRRRFARGPIHAGRVHLLQLYEHKSDISVTILVGECDISVTILVGECGISVTILVGLRYISKPLPTCSAYKIRHRKLEVRLKLTGTALGNRKPFLRYSFFEREQTAVRGASVT